jgi:hypothetical protein
VCFIDIARKKIQDYNPERHSQEKKAKKKSTFSYMNEIYTSKKCVIRYLITVCIYIVSSYSYILVMLTGTIGTRNIKL